MMHGTTNIKRTINLIVGYTALVLRVVYVNKSFRYDTSEHFFQITFLKPTKSQQQSYTETNKFESINISGYSVTFISDNINAFHHI
jgi:hypothetical protein